MSLHVVFDTTAPLYSEVVWCRVSVIELEMGARAGGDVWIRSAGNPYSAERWKKARRSKFNADTR